MIASIFHFSTLENCSFIGNIKLTSQISAGSVEIVTPISGIVDSCTTGSIVRNCTFSGDIKAVIRTDDEEKDNNEYFIYAVGIASQISDGAKIENCTVNGTITASTPNSSSSRSYPIVGGIVGRVYSVTHDLSSGDITNCTSYALLEGNNLRSDQTGGIVGYIDSCTLTFCPSILNLFGNNWNRSLYIEVGNLDNSNHKTPPQPEVPDTGLTSPDSPGLSNNTYLLPVDLTPVLRDKVAELLGVSTSDVHILEPSYFLSKPWSVTSTEGADLVRRGEKAVAYSKR